MAHSVRPGDGLIGLCPGATYGPAKRWFQDRFVSLGRDLFHRHHVRLLIIGSAEEHETLEDIAREIGRAAMVVDGFTLGICAAIIKRCRVIISNDTGLMHVAAALKVPVVALFGSTSSVWTGPRGPAGGVRHVISREVPCSPCFRRTCGRRERDYLCFQKIQVADVVEVVEKVLAKVA